MKAVIAAMCAGTVLSGCVGTDLSKLVPGSASQLQAAFQTTADREATLITALQLENDTLDFMSAGTYRCGDIQDKQLQRFLNAKDPAQFVKEEKVSEAWTKSLEFLQAYLKALNSIVATNKQEQEDIASLTSIAGYVAKYVPGFPDGTAAAASAFEAVIKDAFTYLNAARMQDAARRMEAPLEAAVANIKKFYPVYVGNEHTSFLKWDSCAREKLRFIRDNPQLRVHGYPALFAADSGTRLDEAYAAYIAKRDQLRGTPAIAELAKAVLDENKKLADPLKNLSLSDLAKAGTNAGNILDDLKAAVKAGEALGITTAKASNGGSKKTGT